MKDPGAKSVNGELMEQFKKTLYFEELEKFCIETMKDLRDNVIDSALRGDYEESRDQSQRLAGFKLISDFIDDTISTRAEEIQTEKEAKEFSKQLPHRL
jgi:hypothetical protein